MARPYVQAEGSGRKTGSVARTLTKRRPIAPVNGAEKRACHGPLEQARSAMGVSCPGRTETVLRPPG